MRISTSWTQHTSVTSMLEQQSNLQQTQLQLSSGKRLLSPSDDPAAAGRVLDLNQSLQQTEQYQNNIEAARRRLSLQDSTLQDVTESLHRLKELTIQGLSDTNNASDRNIIATEIDAINEHLLGLANTKNANGEYLFGGFKSTTQPFSKTAGVYSYAGDANQRLIQIGDNRQIADGDPGQSIFGNVTGTTPVPGSSSNIFEAAAKLADDLRANTPNSASLDDIANALEKVLAIEASVGSRLKTLDTQEDNNAKFMLDTKTVLSATEDLDYAEAITRFNQQQISLQAAQQAFAQVKKLSLFNYL